MVAGVPAAAFPAIGVWLTAVVALPVVGCAVASPDDARAPALLAAGAVEVAGSRVSLLVIPVVAGVAGVVACAAGEVAPDASLAVCDEQADASTSSTRAVGTRFDHNISEPPRSRTCSFKP
jgi:hypothetical protein